MAHTAFLSLLCLTIDFLIHSMSFLSPSPSI